MLLLTIILKKIKRNGIVLYEKKSWSANYPFSVNHVTKFIEFAENSGGFEIC